jgi:hypothetical protein
VSPTIAEIAKDQGIKELLASKIVIVSKPGVGKTWWAGTWPKPTVLNVDPGGARTYLKRPDIFGHVEFHDYSEDNKRFPTAFNKVTTHALEIANEWKKTGESYERTLVLDSMSFLSKLALNKAKPWYSSTKRTKAVKEQIEHHQRVPDTLDYRVAMSFIEDFLGELCAINPLRLIVTCHEYQLYDKVILPDGSSEMGEVKEILPSVIGQLRERLGAYFDEVWLMTAEKLANKEGNRKRTIHVLPTLKFASKSRWEGIFPPSLEANADEIIRQVKEHFKKLTQENKQPSKQEKVNG